MFNTVRGYDDVLSACYPAIFMPHIIGPKPRILHCRSSDQGAYKFWGTFKDSLVEGITVDEIKQRGVATCFDYVIVGGGPGGLTLAMRLTEYPNIPIGRTGNFNLCRSY
jgi:hypothetical protein